MDERDMMHGRDWSGQSVVGWQASEKYDGVRAYWDGQTLWTRSGRPIALPGSLARQLPTCPLDGEVWAGYGEFNAARAAANRGRFSAAVRFIVFDAPGESGAWPARLAAARARIGQSLFCEVVTPVEIQSHAQLDALFCAVKARGGEGLMLRHPGPLRYYRQRTDLLLKLKRRPVSWIQRLLAA